MTPLLAVWWQPAFMPFFCLLALAVGLIVLESFGQWIGLYPTRRLLKLFPCWLNPLACSTSSLSRFWLMLIFVISVAIIGIGLQLMSFAVRGELAAVSYTLLIATLVGWLLALLLYHSLNQIILPYQLNPDSHLIGRLGTIVSGHAKPGATAQAVVRDGKGRLHYVMIEAEFGELELQSRVILVAQRDGTYIAKKITPLQRGKV